MKSVPRGYITTVWQPAIIAILILAALPGFGQPKVPDWNRRFEEVLGSSGEISYKEAEARFRDLFQAASTADQKAAAALEVAKVLASGPEQRRGEADPFFADAVKLGSGRFALDARNSWGVALLRQGRAGEAEVVLANLHQENLEEVEASTRARYFYNYGAALQRTGQSHKAISFYEKALRQDPGLEPASQALFRFTFEIRPFGPLFVVPAPSRTFTASLDALFSPLLDSGRTETARRYLETLWNQRLLLVDRETVFPRWAFWLVRYLKMAGVSPAEFESDWGSRLGDPSLNEAVRNSPWIVRIREAYQADLPLVLDEPKARTITSPWSRRDEEATALSELLQTVADGYREQGQGKAALVRYALAWSSAKNWKAGVYLTDLVQQAPAELDADGRILGALKVASKGEQMAPRDAEGWRDLSRFHVLLAQNREKQAVSTGLVDAWKLALAAHERANGLASKQQPAPALYAGLGDAYLKAEHLGDAFPLLMLAAEQYLVVGRPDLAAVETAKLSGKKDCVVDCKPQTPLPEPSASLRLTLLSQRASCEVFMQTLLAGIYHNPDPPPSGVQSLEPGVTVSGNFTRFVPQFYSIKASPSRRMVLYAESEAPLIVRLRGPSGEFLDLSGTPGFGSFISAMFPFDPVDERVFYVEITGPNDGSLITSYYSLRLDEFSSDSHEGLERLLAECLSTEGSFLIAKKTEVQRALDRFEAARSYWRRLREPTREAWSLVSIAMLQVDLDQSRAAEASFSEALAFWERLGHLSQQADSLRAIGSLQFRREDVAAAHTTAERELEIRRRVADYHGVLEVRRKICQYRPSPEGDATCLFIAGLADRTAGDHARSVAALEASTSLFEERGDRLSAWIVLVTLAEFDALEGRTDKALARYERALALLEELEGSQEQVSLENLQMLLVGQVGFSTSLESNSQILKSILLLFADAISRTGYGGALLDAGRLLEAETQLTKAGGLLQLFGGPLEAKVLLRFGELRKRQWLLKEAKAYYERFLATIESLSLSGGADPAQVGVFGSLAEIESLTGNFHAALAWNERALAFARNSDDRLSETAILQHRAELELRGGRLEGAAQLLQEALTRAAEIGDDYRNASILADLSYLSMLRGSYQTAANQLERAVGLLEMLEPDVGEGRILLGSLRWRSGDFESARRLWNQVLGEAHTVGSKSLARSALAAFSSASWQEGKSDEALENFGQAANLLDGVTKPQGEEVLASSLGGERRWLYEIQVELLVREGRFQEAFEVAERARSHSLLNLLGNHPLSTARSGDSELLAEAEALRLAIASWENKVLTATSSRRRALTEDLLNARQRHAVLLNRLKATNPEYSILVTNESLSVKRIQDYLPAETTLISYFVTASASYSWVIDRATFRFVRLAMNRTDLEQAICWAAEVGSTQDEARGGGGCGHETDLAEDLFMKLIAPLRRDIRHRRLIIFPDSELHYLPFVALRDPNTGRRLIGDYTLSYAPSTSVLSFLRYSVPSSRRKVLVFGVQEDVGPAPLPRLASIQEEARAVAGFFGSRPLVGAEAAEGRLDNVSGAHLVHFAAHGVYEPSKPLFTRVVLAPDEKHDGNLEVHEILSNLDFSGVSLVVLSACETARGERGDGDEITGLPWAFLHAGASAVVSTLWKSSDTASASLVADFYRRLDSGVPAAEALREAQLRISRQPEYQDPFYWAGFRLTGSPDSYASPTP